MRVTKVAGNDTGWAARVASVVEHSSRVWRWSALSVFACIVVKAQVRVCFRSCSNTESCLPFAENTVDEFTNVHLSAVRYGGPPAGPRPFAREYGSESCAAGEGLPPASGCVVWRGPGPLREVAALPRELTAPPREAVPLPREPAPPPRRLTAVPREAVPLPPEAVPLPPEAVPLPPERPIHPRTAEIGRSRGMGLRSRGTEVRFRGRGRPARTYASGTRSPSWKAVSPSREAALLPWGGAPALPGRTWPRPQDGATKKANPSWKGSP